MTQDAAENLTPAEARARDAVRSLPKPEADPAFHARLRREFVSGSLANAPGHATAGGRMVRGPWLAWTRRLSWAAAAAFLVATAVGLNRGPAWQVSSITGSGIAVVDGRPVPLEHMDELSMALHRGARIAIPEGAKLDVMAKNTLMVQITGGTEMVMPEPPGRWFGRASKAEIKGGEARITTGPGFKGARLAIATPEARVMVTGTTLAVICEPQGTCVCVLEGEVEVGGKDGAMAPVTSGRRRYVFNDGRPPEVAEMRPTEVEPLGRFRQRFERVGVVKR